MSLGRDGAHEIHGVPALLVVEHGWVHGLAGLAVDDEDGAGGAVHRHRGDARADAGVELIEEGPERAAPRLRPSPLRHPVAPLAAVDDGRVPSGRLRHDGAGVVHDGGARAGGAKVEAEEERVIRGGGGGR